MGDDDQEWEITGNYYAGYPGRMYLANGDPGDPPEPAEIEFYEATHEKLKLSFDEFLHKFTVTGDILDRWYDLAVEQLHEPSDED